MRIACPVCATAYEVPEARLTPGRALRCGRCGHQWVPADTPALDASMAAPEPIIVPDAPSWPQAVGIPVSAPPDVFPAAQEPVAEPERSAEPPLRLSRAVEIAGARLNDLALAGWIVTLAAVGALIWAAYGFRSQIMTVWPPSQRVYHLFGAAPPRPPAAPAPAAPAPEAK